MEYVYAALILNETDEEINEDNLTEVLEAAGADIEDSRVKALVAALEDIDIEEAVDQAAAVPAGGAGGAGGAAAGGAGGEADTEEADEEADAEEADDEEAEPDDDEDDDAGEGLGELFG